MADIPLDKASLISLWIESLFYGAFAVLFVICLWILVFSKAPHSKVNMPLLLTAVAMFSFSTMHMFVGLARGIDAFIGSKEQPLGALGYYAEIWNWLSIFKQAIYVTNNIVADGLVVYRCYIVWGFNIWIIVGPVIMVIATTISGYVAVWQFSQVTPGSNVFTKGIAEWGTALFSLSLATNLIVTGLIAVRIWWIARKASANLGSGHGNKYNNAVAIIVESGAIYTVSLTTLLILYLRKTNAQYIVFDALAQIMGIVPTLIIVRVGLGLSTQEAGTFQATNNAKFSERSTAQRSVPVPMQIRKVVAVDSDADDFDDMSKARSYYPGGDHV